MSMEKNYSIGEFAKLTGVTERTLRHYDQMELLKPSGYTKHGHRIYNNNSIAQLQKILLLKFLDLSLGEISEYLKQPEQNLAMTLVNYAQMLEENENRLKRFYKPLPAFKVSFPDPNPSITIRCLYSFML
ncbi:MerR family transcriptional regulator [Niallia circulans]|uniref:MerR family transcriptional regulator n=1 Tax=Niallia circulans TaxID=1397 RepID=UPI003D97C318